MTHDNQPITGQTGPLLTARLDRSLVHVEGGSVRHLVVTVRAPVDDSAATKPRQPLNLGLVIDASGSMAGAPLDAAKSAALGVIEALRDADHLSLVSFASDCIFHANGVRMTADGRQTAAEAIRPLDTRGSTDLGGGWLLGCEGVARRQAAADAPERNRVILLSDGHANLGECDPGVLARHARALQDHGVLTSTVGIGIGYSPIQLQAIAEQGGGRMHDAERPEEILEIVLAELVETLTTTVENVELRLTLPDGMTAEIYGTTPTTTAGNRFSALLGAMTSGTTRNIVVKLTCPPGAAASRLPIGVAASWRTPDSPAAHACEVGSLEVHYGSGQACLAQPRDAGAAKTVAEQWQAHIYHRAVVLNQDGEREAAATFVKRELTYFSTYCQGIPGTERFVRGIIELLPSVLTTFSARDAKEMLLSTYKMTRGEVDRRSIRRETVDEIVRSHRRKQ
ncbi:MAG: VWA domain-containing protein [Planctomycetota bacterium]|nr:VWA domain-containing protein [Planctomycetota bacterium]